MKFQIYIDAAVKYRWRLKADNGEVIANSGQGYTVKEHCKDAIKLVQGSADADIVDEAGPRLGEFGTS